MYICELRFTFASYVDGFTWKKTTGASCDFN